MKRLLTSCFGLGRLPVAPGTWASLPVAIVFGLMCQLHASGISISIVMAVLALAGSIICVRFAPAAIAATGKNDPGEVVRANVHLKDARPQQRLLPVLRDGLWLARDRRERTPHRRLAQPHPETCIARGGQPVECGVRRLRRREVLRRREA